MYVIADPTLTIHRFRIESGTLEQVVSVRIEYEFILPQSYDNSHSIFSLPVGQEVKDREPMQTCYKRDNICYNGFI